MCTSDVAVDIQQCNDGLHAATATAAPTANLDNSEACVKKLKHKFEDKNGHFGASKALQIMTSLIFGLHLDQLMSFKIMAHYQKV